MKNMETSKEKNYIGIDIGGMSVKGMAVTDGGKTLAEHVVTTEGEGGDALADAVIGLTDRLIALSGLELSDFVGVGIGCPGVIDSENGVVVFAGNLALKNYPLVKAVERGVRLPVKITNDANAAALGEVKFGAGKSYGDAVLITLGTGVGGGVIINGKLFEGFKSAGAELGHMVIAEGGRQCTCGRRGCFEAYASATALMRSAAEAMKSDRSSAMWGKYTPETVTGRTAFEYADRDASAKRVVGEYVRYLACGIANIVNIFRPRAVILGGGVCAQGERLLKPVREIVEKEVFGGTEYADLEIAAATLGNKAGAFGAASLFMA